MHRRMRGRLAAPAAGRAAVSLAAGLVAGAALLGGCADPKLDRMIEVRDLVCQCKDAACVDAAMAQMPAKSPRDERRAQQTAREILACVAQVGATPPDAVVQPPADEPPAPGTAAPPAGPDAAPSK